MIKIWSMHACIILLLSRLRIFVVRPLHSQQFSLESQSRRESEKIQQAPEISMGTVPIHE